MSKTNGTPSIVDLYQNGMAVKKIAKRKRVSLQDVYRVLNSSGIRGQNRCTIPILAFTLLAALQNSPEKTLKEIADEHGVARQRIGQVLTVARNSGMRFPGRPSHPEKRPHCSTQQTETTK